MCDSNHFHFMFPDGEFCDIFAETCALWQLISMFGDLKFPAIYPTLSQCLSVTTSLISSFSVQDLVANAAANLSPFIMPVRHSSRLYFPRRRDSFVHSSAEIRPDRLAKAFGNIWTHASESDENTQITLHFIAGVIIAGGKDNISLTKPCRRRKTVTWCSFQANQVGSYQNSQRQKS